jgi:hypothetical protein
MTGKKEFRYGKPAEATTWPWTVSDGHRRCTTIISDNKDKVSFEGGLLEGFRLASVKRCFCISTTPLTPFMSISQPDPPTIIHSQVEAASKRCPCCPQSSTSEEALELVLLKDISGNSKAALLCDTPLTRQLLQRLSLTSSIFNSFLCLILGNLSRGSEHDTSLHNVDWSCEPGSDRSSTPSTDCCCPSSF